MIYKLYVIVMACDMIHKTTSRLSKLVVNFNTPNSDHLWYAHWNQFEANLKPIWRCCDLISQKPQPPPAVACWSITSNINTTSYLVMCQCFMLCIRMKNFELMISIFANLTAVLTQAQWALVLKALPKWINIILV